MMLPATVNEQSFKLLSWNQVSPLERRQPQPPQNGFNLFLLRSLSRLVFCPHKRVDRFRQNALRWHGKSEPKENSIFCIRPPRRRILCPGGYAYAAFSCQPLILCDEMIDAVQSDESQHDEIKCDDVIQQLWDD